MTLNTSVIVALINFVVGIFVAILSVISFRRLRGGMLAWVPGIFLLCSALYVIHAGVEVFNLGKDLYALTALITTLLFGLCLFVIDRTIRLMGS